MTPGALLDSSVWVCYLRPQGWENLKAAVQRAIEREAVAICCVVKAEVLVGTRNDRAFAQLLHYLSALPDMPITETVWGEAARLGYDLRRQGITLPLPDLLVAQTALTHSLELWHVDGHFELIHDLCGLRTRSFLPDTQ